ncbi:MAG TPA: mycofactocin-coupled SDR family oxidoreductase [Gordonia sp. (in: high G+C Gram-positive bacteria)]|uniref:mycofactocin-coupled SDR family oxidoreductase n=1 Tax=unclassified Gordonia (in: high G+C Gram-positive bacteria) TaxID=2657482 RepID=UPI000FB089B8|nr:MULTISPECIES: mycofactocin-coupled SDR family oxidoreductase [unclassified Gordonia (in: high G+C Gram-positive bacteria)]RUP35501.1 MAG: NAD(P)-dependent oxidoreductase [Gordonia sp. (in: high G+C Gram-positive bacteria)]HNP57673.1 mycofactocin-coupled SDR family oxidoreductase [Gordonia sp. (in: high G+C Gram-positive bacteria)]HRC50682.1 mycofactocin-coupled SDR family oxidoreductase [Gordonia sp. (in: high G+C Gram-positive bacteria)]
MGQFDGQVVYITGIARGQGRNHAVRFAAEGASIIGMDIAARVADHQTYPTATEDDLAETVRLVEEAGGKILARKGDTRDLAFQEQLVADGFELFGRLDHVVANAGILTWGLTWEQTEEQFTDVIDVNLVGTWKTLKATIPTMRKARNGGSITIISSTAGLKAMPNQASYSASKFALRGLAQSVAKELGPKHIRVNTVHPYAVHTPMGVEDTSAFKSFEDWPEHFPSMMNHYPIASVDDLSDAVLYLAGAKAVTGAEFAIDMGSSKV